LERAYACSEFRTGVHLPCRSTSRCLCLLHSDPVSPYAVTPPASRNGCVLSGTWHGLFGAPSCLPSPPLICLSGSQHHHSGSVDRRYPRCVLFSVDDDENSFIVPGSNRMPTWPPVIGYIESAEQSRTAEQNKIDG